MFDLIYMISHFQIKPLSRVIVTSFLRILKILKNILLPRNMYIYLFIVFACIKNKKIYTEMLYSIDIIEHFRLVLDRVNQLKSRVSITIIQKLKTPYNFNFFFLRRTGLTINNQSILAVIISKLIIKIIIFKNELSSI